MDLFPFPPESKKENSKSKQLVQRKKPPPSPPPFSAAASSWEQIKIFLTCKQIEKTLVHNPTKRRVSSISKLGSSCISNICSVKDGVIPAGNARVVHRADNSPETTSTGHQTELPSRLKAINGSSSSSRTRSTSLSEKSKGGAGTSSYTSSSTRGMQLRKLSGCYECHYIVDPSRSSISRTTISTCPQCREVFPKIENLELHQAIRHAVSELGPEDSGRNIVEIIFKSSWHKKDNPICTIERILKVHNTQRTIQRFEDCRETVKARAVLNSTRRNARCAADGNELLRFYCSGLSCTLGARGYSSLCGSIPGCGVCTIIRYGFQGKEKEKDRGDCIKLGVRTTASSGRAHDSLCGEDIGRRAMLVCRVIAGRVRNVEDDAPPDQDSLSAGSYDSVAAFAGIYSNLEELVVYNPRAILPCFVVIYKALESRY